MEFEDIIVDGTVSPRTPQPVFLRVLKARIRGRLLEHRGIGVVPDIYTHDPWDLHSRAKKIEGQIMWLFFAPNEKKVNARNAPHGHWAEVGRVRIITADETLVGREKLFAFYKNRPKISKTEWRINQYSLQDGPKEDYVFCVLWRYQMSPQEPVLNPFDQCTGPSLAASSSCSSQASSSRTKASVETTAESSSEAAIMRDRVDQRDTSLPSAAAKNNRQKPCVDSTSSSAASCVLDSGRFNQTVAAELSSMTGSTTSTNQLLHIEASSETGTSRGSRKSRRRRAPMPTLITTAVDCCDRFDTEATAPVEVDEDGNGHPSVAGDIHPAAAGPTAASSSSGIVAKPSSSDKRKAKPPFIYVNTNSLFGLGENRESSSSNEPCAIRSKMDSMLHQLSLLLTKSSASGEATVRQDDGSQAPCASSSSDSAAATQQDRSRDS